MTRWLTVLALISVSLATPAGLVDAGKGGKGGGGGPKETGSAVVLDQSAPSFGDHITFTVSTTATSRPFVELTCRQQSVLVYSQTHGHFPQYIDLFGEPVYVMSSTSWTAGGAECVASLKYQARNGRWRSLASLTFDVNP